jgi:hypothetical protein
MPNDYQIPLITERPDGTPGTLKTLADGGLQFAGYEPNGGKMLVGTARDRFFENFATFDTSPTGDWEIVQTGPGMTITGPLGGAVAGSGPYLNVASGVTAASKTIILSRSTFSMPLDLRYQISASQRIANNHLLVGFVQVNDSGAIVTDTSRSTAPEVLNARNAVFHQHDSTTATTAQLRVRAGGSALDTLANAFGTGFTTVATGTGPNFIPATTYGLMLERDRISARSWGQNVLTNTGGQFAYDRLLVNPNRSYKMAIIVENVAAPASSTDWRLHLINILDATRFDVSPRSAGTSDLSKAFTVTGAVAQAGAWSFAIAAAQTLANVTAANLGIPGTIADVASLALTATATTAALTPTFGCSYEVNIPVTAATGTNPTLDVTIEESDDAGTNWFRVYDFPRITATGIYRSPKLPLTGNRVRYVQTVGGTTPSFTRAVNRLQCSDMADPVRQNVDRSVVLTTLNSTTPSLNVQNCRNAQIVVNIGAATTPPALQLEGSDDNGATWYALGSPLTAVASSSVRAAVNNVQAQLLRARVSSAGSAVTAGYVTVKGF